MNEQGSVVCSKEEIHQVAVTYFSNLSTTPLVSGIPTEWSNLFQSMASTENLNRNFVNEEVRVALFSIGALKVLGPNGLPALFFQNL